MILLELRVVTKNIRSQNHDEDLHDHRGDPEDEAREHD
jgi:hypothetical protein